MRLLCVALLACLSSAAGAETCSARSESHTVALVELYTSEGCNSCPPADRWLSSLGAQGYVPGRVVPLSLHVDYWDYLGWKDPFAQKRFSGRQRKLTQLQRLAFVYTPQVMVQGQDFRKWRDNAEFSAAVAQINARPARAALGLQIEALRQDAMTVRVDAILADPAQQEDAALYVAAYENRLKSGVQAGENRGSTLSHDYVVLEWQGPLAFARGPRRSERRELPLLPGAVPTRSGVAAFVQNRRSLEVLQALMLPACGD